jgi:hypothetical protein
VGTTRWVDRHGSVAQFVDDAHDELPDTDVVAILERIEAGGRCEWPS